MIETEGTFPHQAVNDAPSRAWARGPRFHSAEANQFGPPPNWLKTLGLVGGPIKATILESRLNRAIQSPFRYQAREESGVQSPARILMLGSGSCRDYADLFIEACRRLGLASRFVSGFLHAPATEAGNATTHARAEVFLPGLGLAGLRSHHR